MPDVTVKLQKGNYAESIATSWLSRKCLVRPVPAGTDIGIDLYCESLIGTSPFQHFWVQVKAIPKENLTEDAAFFDFKTAHLQYWSNQPVPVYGFLVPVLDWPPPDVKTIWGVRITDQIVRNGIPDQTTVRYHTSDGLDVANLDADLAKFVSVIVPYDTALIYLQKGLVAPIAKVGEDPLERFPSDVALRYVDRFLQAIRYAVELTLAELVSEEARTHVQRPERPKIHSIATLFPDELTALGLSAVANSTHLDGDLNMAREYLGCAKNWINQSEMSPTQKAEAIAKADMMLQILSGA